MQTIIFFKRSFILGLIIFSSQANGALGKLACSARVAGTKLNRTQAVNTLAVRNLSDAWKAIMVVRQGEKIVIERFGKFDRILTPGLRFKWPFIENSRPIELTYTDSRGSRHSSTENRIDTREQVHTIPNQSVITKDNVGMLINGIVYFEITDPQKAAYGVQDMNHAVDTLAQTILRNVIGGMHLDETLSARDKINKTLFDALKQATEKWGVLVTRVELKEVNPPEEIRIAMEKQMRAERERRAEILDAEGKKKAAILLAEGKKQSEILLSEGNKQSEILNAEAISAAAREKAKGESEAIIMRAEADAKARLALANADAQALETMQNAAPGQNMLGYLATLKYVAALQEMTQQGDKTVVVPYDATALLGATSMVKEMLSGQAHNAAAVVLPGKSVK